MARPYDSKISDRGYFVLLSATLVTCALMTLFICMRVITIAIETRYTLADFVMALLLVGAELFLCMHAAGYFFNLFKCGRRQATLQPMMFARHVRVPVALLVAAFNEAEDVLEDTLATARAMDYPFNLYLLDDSTRPECREGADRVARKYGARLVRRTNRAGYKAGAINDLIPHLTEKYIALLDADQRPTTSWLTEMVPHMEDHPELALVQSPQHYTNYEGLPVCEAAKYQQAMFYEYICEGKSYSNAMFCCGSNVVIRREALLSLKKDVNGRTHYFDETSVTEDFATSFLLQLRGWGTDYVNHPYAVGMGPETLDSYFVQQMRWAMGTQGRARRIIRELFRNPRAMRPAQWWEYWMVSTYYFIGFAHFIFMIAPMAFMLFDVKPVRANVGLYLAFFVPYIICTMNLFYFGMGLRRYDARGIWIASALSMSTFWIYMKAGVVAIFGLKRAFGVTPKGVGGAIPLRRLWMELTMFTGCVATSAWCAYHLLLGGGLAYAINGFWATYHAVMLSTLFFHFNRAVTVRPRPSLFEATPAAA